MKTVLRVLAVLFAITAGMIAVQALPTTPITGGPAQNGFARPV